jgi:hypothetical protein
MALSQSVKDRPCDACGGEGAFPLWDGSLAEVPCHICWGVGRISDVIPVKDALADAETLRTIAHDVAAHCYGGYWDGPTCAACKAAVDALRIYCPLTDGDTSCSSAFYADPFERAAGLMAERAQYEARAAFRACPGLRGE